MIPTTGAPARGRIGLHTPEIGREEWERVRECLERGWISSAGEVTNEFERGVAAYLGVTHAVAVSSGTSALHVALLVAGVTPGDEVIVPSMTFVASVNAVTYCGAKPVFIDITPDTWTLDPAKVAAFLAENCETRGGSTFNRRTGARVAAILPVHILGHPVDMDPLLAAAGSIPVVEDAAESLGARYKGRMVGSLGSAACLSFNGSKIVTTGGGGMVVTNDDAWAKRIRHLTTQARTDSREYIHDEVGYNYRLPAINAAIGIAQIERLPALLQKKVAVAEYYRHALSGIAGLQVMPAAQWAEPTWWLYTIRVVDDAPPARRDAALDALMAAGAEARPLWRPSHMLPMYAEAERYRLEHTEPLYRTAISLPSSPGITREEQDLIVSTIRGALEARS